MGAVQAVGKFPLHFELISDDCILVHYLMHQCRTDSLFLKKDDRLPCCTVCAARDRATSSMACTVTLKQRTAPLLSQTSPKASFWPLHRSTVSQTCTALASLRHRRPSFSSRNHPHLAHIVHAPLCPCHRCTVAAAWLHLQAEAFCKQSDALCTGCNGAKETTVAGHCLLVSACPCYGIPCLQPRKLRTFFALRETHQQVHHAAMHSASV